MTDLKSFSSKVEAKIHSYRLPIRFLLPKNALDFPSAVSLEIDCLDLDPLKFCYYCIRSS